MPAGPTRPRFSRGGDPFQRGQVVERGRRDRGRRRRSNSSRVLSDRERRGLEPGAGVGGVAGGDLGLDQGAQQLLGCPPLGLRGEQQLGGELAHRGQLEPAQPARPGPARQRRACGHDASSSRRRRRRVARGAAPVGGRWRSRPAAGSGRRAARGPARPRRAGAGRPGAGGEDGAHVGGAPPAERDRPAQRGDERVVAVRGAQRVQLGQLGAEPGVAGRGGAGDERLRGRAERAELPSPPRFSAAPPGAARGRGPP